LFQGFFCEGVLSQMPRLRYVRKTTVTHDAPLSVRAGAAHAAILPTSSANIGRDKSDPYPRTPDDPCLVPSGAVVVQEGPGEGRLCDSAYVGFISHFANEVAADRHPHVHAPGLGANEIHPEGLKLWDDAPAAAFTPRGQRGAGWIACKPVRLEGQDKPEEKWFNIRTWGSWRLAFLLARLQRKVWESRVGLTPLDHRSEDNMVNFDGMQLSPAELRRLAHQVAQSLRHRDYEGVDVGSYHVSNDPINVPSLSNTEASMTARSNASSSTCAIATAKEENPPTQRAGMKRKTTT